MTPERLAELEKRYLSTLKWCRESGLDPKVLLKEEVNDIIEVLAEVRMLLEQDAFLRGLVHDLKEESDAYRRGVADGFAEGYRRKTEEVDAMFKEAMDRAILGRTP